MRNRILAAAVLAGVAPCRRGVWQLHRPARQLHPAHRRPPRPRLGTSRRRRDREDRDDRRGDGADQRQGLHAVLVRPRHRHQVQLQRDVCRVLAAGHGTGHRGPGVTGKLGTIKRSDGSEQATYDGHPLYTYVGDTAPGQAKGNGLNLSGGVWHEMTASGAAAPAPAASQ